LRQVILDNVRLGDPAGHPLAFSGERGEQFQISILDDDLIRVEHFPSGKPRLTRTWMVVGKDGSAPREGRRRDDLSPFRLPPFEIEKGERTLRLRTRQLQLDITLNPPAISWSDAGGQPFAADSHGRAYAYDRAGTTTWHFMEHRPDEHYYGFGERSGELDKSGRRMRMLNLDALGYSACTSDPLYKHFPFYITFVPDLQIAYGLFYDNLATTTFEMGGEFDAYHGRYRYYQADDGDLDYYLIYGPSIEQVVEKFTALTGRMTLPPRWSLGYLGSTMAYTDAPDAQEQLAQFVALCSEHNIPCDLFHLSSGYTLDENEQRNVFTWNRKRIPDPKSMVDNFSRAGIQLAANIKPALLTTHPRYGEVANFGGFVKAAESDTPQISTFWGGEASYLDFTNSMTFDWWKRSVREQLLDYGISSTWNDNNEFEIWDDDARCAGFGDSLRIGLVRPLQTMLMARASYEAQRESRPNERPYLITRSACPGVQRYAQTWSGDNMTSWESLKYNIPMGLGLSLSGMPNTGHDVGGFTGLAPSPELLVRWVQNGVFHPRFTIHSWHLDGTVNAPWMYPEVLPIVREWIEFRYRLIPYLYSLLFEAAKTGHPIIRPLVYAFPHDVRCQGESFDFMLGPHLLVASVFEENARTRRVYLPSAPGTTADPGWYDFYSGKWHRGGQVIDVEAPLERIPLFVRSGGIIPMGKSMKHIGAEPDDARRAYVFPHPAEGTGRFMLIEDDGVTLDYEHGKYAQVLLEVAAEQDSISLSTRISGDYQLPYKTLEFILPAGERRRITARGDSWIDANNQVHIITRVDSSEEHV
jgi:alpha-glucosidase